MTVVGRVVELEQTVLVVVEDDCLALLVSFGDETSETLDNPDDAIFLGTSGAQRLAAALVEGAERIKASA